jgi:hypothetical protein
MQPTTIGLDLATALAFNTVNPIMVQGAAFGDP